MLSYAFLLEPAAMESFSSGDDMPFEKEFGRVSRVLGSELEQRQFANVATVITGMLYDDEEDEDECIADQQIELYLRNGLVNPDIFLVEEHLKKCASCRRRLRMAKER